MPVSLGVCLELAYPSSKIREKHSRNNIPLNDFIDAILRTVYHTSALSEGRPSGSGPGVDSAHTHGFGYGYQSQSQSTGRRKVIFTSFSADACAAVNWKQPNCESFSGRVFCLESSASPCRTYYNTHAVFHLSWVHGFSSKRTLFISLVVGVVFPDNSLILTFHTCLHVIDIMHFHFSFRLYPRRPSVLRITVRRKESFTAQSDGTHRGRCLRPETVQSPFGCRVREDE